MAVTIASGSRIARRFYWIIGGLAAEGDAWSAAVAAFPAVPSLHYAQTLLIAGEFPRGRGEPERALGLKLRALVVLDQLAPGDPDVDRCMAACHTDIADVYSQLGDFESADEHTEAALAIRRELGDAGGIAHALSSLGVVAERRGAFEDAVSAYAEAVALLDSIGEPSEAAGALCSLGLVHRRFGDIDVARAALEEALRRGLASGDRLDAVYARAGLALVAFSEGSTEEAVAELSRARTEMGELALVFDIEDEIDAALATCRAELGEDAYLAALESGAAPPGTEAG